MLTFAVYALIVILILTKLADALTTLRASREPGEEKNPVFGTLFKILGVRKSIILNFILASTLFVFSGWFCIKLGALAQIIYLVIFIPYSFVQASVAYGNWTKKDNFIRKGIYSIFNFMEKIFKSAR